jgi:hypothetical protein
MKISTAKKYDDRDRGALFKNDRKEADTDPDYRGQLDVGGVAHWISAWIKVAKSGQKYMSLSVRAKQEQQPQRRPLREDLGDEVAF